MSMARIILSGFVPYGGFQENPSAEVAMRMQDKIIGGAKVESVILPVSFRHAFNVLRAVIESGEEPRIIINTGLMPFASSIQVERVAINVKDFDGIPDNEGMMPRDETIIKDGPPAYFATLPVRRIVEKLIQAGIPATISNTAGTHLCNFIMYNVLDYIIKRGWRTKAGFIHFPFLPQQLHKLMHRPSNTPSLPLDTMVRAIEVSIFATIESE
jgi:pyroglutamyl-peptidase